MNQTDFVYYFKEGMIMMSEQNSQPRFSSRKVFFFIMADDNGHATKALTKSPNKG